MVYYWPNYSIVTKLYSPFSVLTVVHALGPSSSAIFTADTQQSKVVSGCSPFTYTESSVDDWFTWLAHTTLYCSMSIPYVWFGGCHERVSDVLQILLATRFCGAPGAAMKHYEKVYCSYTVSEAEAEAIVLLTNTVHSNIIRVWTVWCKIAVKAIN